MKNIRRSLSIVLFLSILAAAYAGAAQRTALIIGNGDYRISPLKNPVNDANDMAKTLKSNGFDVTLKTNVNLREMESAIRNFGRSLRSGGIGLFYYAGHGLQIKGNNYLVPVGAVIESEGDIKYEAVDAGRVLGKMEDAGNHLNIVILDACRNNPFARSFRSSTPGLARMDAPKGSIIAYATSPGSIAADGTGRNGVYTRHLIRNLKKSHLNVEEVFKNVRIAVVDETQSKQVPWESSSLMGSFYFNEQKPKKVVEEKQVVASAPSPVRTVEKKKDMDRSYEILFWETIKESEDPKHFKAYLNRFPKGVFVELAHLKIEKYTPKPKKTTTASAPAKKKSTARSKPKKEPVKVASIQPSVVKPKPVKRKVAKKPTPKPKKKEPLKVAAVDPADTRPQPEIIARDGQYVKLKNGIVYDEETGTEWYTLSDGLAGISWHKAKSWAEKLNVDGGGWRMPSYAEIQSIYRPDIAGNIPALLLNPGWRVWYSNSSADPFNFRIGKIGSEAYGERYGGEWALAVRSKDGEVPAEQPKDINTYLAGIVGSIKDKIVAKPKKSTPAKAGTYKQGTKVASLNPVNTSIEKQFDRYPNGIVYDSSTGLEWYAGPDKFIPWPEASKWVKRLRLDGGGWRMPTREEYKSIYRKGAGKNNMTPLLRTSGKFLWTGETHSQYSAAWGFDFAYGRSFIYDHYIADTGGDTHWYNGSGSTSGRIFAVRNKR